MQGKKGKQMRGTGKKRNAKKSGEKITSDFLNRNLNTIFMEFGLPLDAVHSTNPILHTEANHETAIQEAGSSNA